MKITIFLLLIATLCIYTTKCTDVDGLHVKGNRIYNGAGQEVRFRGANRPGTEYSCVQHGKIFDGPADQASIDAMRTWKMNIIRVPINEDCWYGKDGVDPSLGGSAYQKAVTDYVTLLTKNDLAVIVDLHWASNGTAVAAHMQLAMPSRATAPALWRDLANTFKGNTAVLFDIYNEPFPDNNAWDSDAAWSCWKSGGYCSGIGYDAAGMEELLAAVRNTGATNIVMIGGIQYATSLVRFLDYLPDDPTGNLMAAVHVYDFNLCRSAGCWDVFWRPVFEKMPLLASEMGQTDCAIDFIWDVMQYADTNGIGYLAWAWLPADCAKDPSIIKDFNGTATDYGIGLQTHLNNLADGVKVPYYNSFNIFADKRTHWVDNWSSLDTVVFFNETSVVHSGQYSIKLQASQTSQLHYMCWGCFNTTTLRGINIWVHGGGNSNQKITVTFLKIDNLRNVPLSTASNSVVYPSIDLASIISGGISATSWRVAYLNMTQIPTGAYDGIVFGTNEQTTQPNIYLDDIRALAVNDDGSYRPFVPNTGTPSVGTTTTSNSHSGSSSLQAGYLSSSFSYCLLLFFVVSIVALV